MKKSKSTAKPKHWFKQWLSISLPVWVVLFALIIWQWSITITKLPAWILPAPSSIFVSLFEKRWIILDHATQTMQETVLGLFIAIVTAIIVALVMDVSPWIRKAIYPLLITSQTVPIIALAPLFLIWFGYGMLPKLLVVALVCFFPIAVNLADGFKEIDEDMLRFMKAIGANRSQIFIKLKLPSALPFFFSGLRIAGTYSVMGAVIGEWLGGSKGLGIQLVRASQSYATDLFFAIILVVVGLSLFIFGIIEIFSRILMPWNSNKNIKS